MSRQKQTVVSFRVDHHLAKILNSLPDKSVFIREAILRRFHTVCPFCGGRGVLPEPLAEWLQSKVPDFESMQCTCCHYEYPAELVHDQSEIASSEPFMCPHCRQHEHLH